MVKFTFAAVLAFGSLCASTPQAPPNVVSSYDLASYTGKWYQIADYPQFYEKFCGTCTTATYTANSDGSVAVKNECRGNPQGKVEVVNAKATIPDSSVPAKLSVKFFNLFPAPYWIIALGEKNADNQYSWALVSNGLREACYILSRTPSLPEDQLDLVYEKMAENQISNSTQKLKFTMQEGCGWNATETKPAYFQETTGLVGGPLHASCKMTFNFPSNSCDQVRNVLSVSAKNMSGTDCGSGDNINSYCRYTETSASATSWKGVHATPKDPHYKDDLSFDFSAAGSGCKAAAYSTSETWYAHYDNGVNYCNLHNLVDRSGVKFTESDVSDSSCTQYSSANCARY
mmetsp:Transcript_15567/g.30563  ORF Transcript_15567/g.30563 Transcript_15567/m.30563 type:complete len:344 (+) Transcript_15567:34-1065(+)|eukprot:CAMPEP_0175137636 /NCGR_PEP_ID=MMETSP0087-20121206/9919_1 /TAXON_ID=136419 /ORGANISM="Unknown Unknown, Strain D1" /LENGTH=343 /DNA_ID=CAMNT_0016420481 /DNA_START=34 /DNA_END=1065 /DNA_ORIENTATION=+